MNRELTFSRVWAMPDADTFSIPAIGNFVARHVQGLETVVDPFARNKRVAKWTNDINPATAAEYHMEARTFLAMLIERGVKADAIIFDPPYSPRQVSECYAAAGLTPTMKDTQTANMKKECRDLMRQIVKRGGKVLTFGWNTVGMGPDWNIEELLLVCHGGDHNDTICMAERQDIRQGVLAFESDKPEAVQAKGATERRKPNNTPQRMARPSTGATYAGGDGST